MNRTFHSRQWRNSFKSEWVIIMSKVMVQSVEHTSDDPHTSASTLTTISKTIFTIAFIKPCSESPMVSWSIHVFIHCKQVSRLRRTFLHTLLQSVRETHIGRGAWRDGSSQWRPPWWEQKAPKKQAAHWSSPARFFCPSVPEGQGSVA